MVGYAVRVCHGIKVLYSTGGRDWRKRGDAVTGAWEGEPASDPAPALHDGQAGAVLQDGDVPEREGGGRIVAARLAHPRPSWPWITRASGLNGDCSSPMIEK
jgi:hypothetical protein